ncbi:hypothetical protein [Actinomadura violacea]|uniref:SH3 domain-containing protein n=1 Tax=Actinomadura violacea TaxID=2819934 RepID=A0ABS3RNF3_9ACTN|nr:hypothetical protein [Actinomadura violacea]MBO2458263.1 hypothetical protein [Actinomadura violacea]
MRTRTRTTALSALAVAALAPLTAGLATTPANAATPAARTLRVAQAAPAGAQVSAAAKCTIRKYSSAGWGEKISHKGKGTAKYNYGVTKYRGRQLILRTGRIYDRSSARILKGYKKGDKVWVDITGNGGKSWQACGSTSGDRTGWFLHDYKKRWIRACMKVDGHVKCATNGNKKGPGKRWWWSDS